MCLPIIEKHLWFHQLLPPFIPPIFWFPQNIFDKSMPVNLHKRLTGWRSGSARQRRNILTSKRHLSELREWHRRSRYHWLGCCSWLVSTRRRRWNSCWSQSSGTKILQLWLYHLREGIVTTGRRVLEHREWRAMVMGNQGRCLTNETVCLCIFICKMSQK